MLTYMRDLAAAEPSENNLAALADAQIGAGQGSAAASTLELKLTRFGGAVQAFRGGFTDAQDTSAIRTGISPSNGRTGPRRPRSGRACPGVRTDRTVDQPLGGASRPAGGPPGGEGQRAFCG